MKFGAERFIQNVVPDLRDNLRSDKIPPIASRKIETPADVLPLMERLLPSNVQDRFFAETAHFASGEYRARVAVGSAEEGTRHPHDYIVQKSDEELVMYFVDPEHQMGMSKKHSKIPLPRKGDVRPKISTLISVRLYNDEAIPDISMLRYRAAAISDPRLLKMDPQFEIAKQILTTGAVPDVLKGKENEITFRMNIRAEEMLAQSRYANQEALDDFLRGKKSAPSIEGKVHSYGVIMRHFLKHLSEQKFHATHASTL
jgi:hypothetical protein